jgi:hypothetical protein
MVGGVNLERATVVAFDCVRLPFSTEASAQRDTRNVSEAGDNA